MAVVLDPVLQEILACPAPDHGSLRPGRPGDSAADALTCVACGRVYPVEDGIPVLLLDEAVLPEGDGRPQASGAEAEGAGDPGDSR